MSSVTVSFVDVGQGDCTTIVDTNGLGILIDCPEGADEVAVRELDLQKCTSLRAAVVTHSDQDHAGGVLDVLEHMAERFDGRLYFNVDSLQSTPVAGLDRRVEGRKRRAFLLRVREYRPILSPALTSNLEQIGMIHWRFASPTYGEVVAAWTGTPNLASAIVVITAFEKNVIISGDAQLSAWENIAGSLPHKATVRWPHHGGRLSGGDQLAAQERLFEICKPAQVIVSVGSKNVNGHPLEAFFAARQAAGSGLICTEASNKCVRGGGPGGVCAGTIRLVLTNDGLKVSTDTVDHKARIKQFGAGRCVDVNIGSAD
jgi:competence protein ComEC